MATSIAATESESTSKELGFGSWEQLDVEGEAPSPRYVCYVTIDQPQSFSSFLIE